ncbi:MAG: hypothetical protein ABI647_06755 [Gemmatimonadota bacterium]
MVVEVAQKVLASTKGGIADFQPSIRYHTFGASSIDFTVILSVREFTDRSLVKHEFIKALARRFSEEQIVIPFPIRAINLAQESSEAQLAAIGGGGGASGTTPAARQ